MTLIRRKNLNPWFDSLFDDFLADAPTLRSELMPSVEFHNEEDKYSFSMELPGVKQEDVNVKFEKGVLTVKGEKKAKKENATKSEFRYGSFERSFQLNSEVDEEKMTANLKDGLLTIDLPKVEAKTPREIPIQIG